jgi:hypothetical protein
MSASAIPKCNKCGVQPRTSGVNKQGKFHKLCPTCYFLCPVCKKNPRTLTKYKRHPTCTVCWKANLANNVMGNNATAWAHMADKKVPIGHVEHTHVIKHKAEYTTPHSTGSKPKQKPTCQCAAAKELKKTCGREALDGKTSCEACLSSLCTHHLRALANAAGLKEVRQLDPHGLILTRCHNRCGNAGSKDKNGYCSAECRLELEGIGEPCSLPYDADDL